MIVNDTANWFKARNLDTAVVGFSGGIDSATTIALLAKAGIRTRMVSTFAPNQMFSSDYDPGKFASQFNNVRAERAAFEWPAFENRVSDDAREAALPILRLAVFYGLAADERAKGYKPVVVGTANFDEAAYLGFWGKASDAAQDFYPISHLHKSEVIDLAKELGVPREIIEATPSGDLLFTDTNDFKMIGADYPFIEKIAHLAEQHDYMRIGEEIFALPPERRAVFMSNIFRNKFKYDLSFPGFHLSSRLEAFRQQFYCNIITGLRVCTTMMQGPMI